MAINSRGKEKNALCYNSFTSHLPIIQNLNFFLTGRKTKESLSLPFSLVTWLDVWHFFNFKHKAWQLQGDRWYTCINFQPRGCDLQWLQYNLASSRFHSQIRKEKQVEYICKITYFNPLPPMPAVTSHAKTHPQFPVPAVTDSEKACEDDCLSYPPWRDFGSPIVLLLLRINKPMRIDFLSICFGDFRGPRKTVFCLKTTRSKSAGNHGALQAKSTNFQSLVFIP